MDVRRLGGSEIVAGAGAIALAAAMFGDWFGGRSAWATLTIGRVLLTLTILLALTLVAVTLRARAVALAMSTATLTVGVGALALVLVLYRVAIDEPGPNVGVSVDAAAYVGLAALLVLLAGAWRTLADERTDAPASLRQTERVLAVRGAPRPAPPSRDPSRDEPPG